MIDMKKLQVTKERIAKGLINTFVVLMIMLMGVIIGMCGMDPAFNDIPGTIAGVVMIGLLWILIVVIPYLFGNVTARIYGKDLLARECPCIDCRIPELMPKNDTRDEDQTIIVT